MWFLDWLRPSVEQQRMDCLQKMIQNQKEIQEAGKVEKVQVQDQKVQTESAASRIQRLQEEYKGIFTQCEQSLKPTLQ